MGDKEILELFKSKNLKKGVKAVYTSYPSIRKLVLENSGSKEDAEDLFQEVVLVLMEKTQMSDFQLTSALSSYLYAIARNLWLKELRKRKKMISESFNDLEEEENESSQEEAKRKGAMEAILKLGHKCQQLLILFYYKRYPFDRIAKLLDFRNDKVAKNQKYRCLEKAKSNYLTLNTK